MSVIWIVTTTAYLIWTFLDTVYCIVWIALCTCAFSCSLLWFLLCISFVLFICRCHSDSQHIGNSALSFRRPSGGRRKDEACGWFFLVRARSWFPLVIGHCCLGDMKSIQPVKFIPLKSQRSVSGAGGVWRGLACQMHLKTGAKTKTLVVLVVWTIFCRFNTRHTKYNTSFAVV